MEGDESDRLPQPHVVGETGAQPQRRHPVQPAEPAHLVVAQRGGERRRLPDGHGVAAFGVGEPVAQPGERAGGLHFHPAAVRVLGGAGQCGAERIERRDLTVLTVPGRPQRLRVDQHPLVVQPHQRPSRLGEPVQLPLVHLLAAHREPPAEGEQGIRGQQGRQPRLRPVPPVGAPAIGRAHHGPTGQRACKLPGPVHLHPGGGQRPAGRTEQLSDFLIGEVQRPGHRRGQQRGERRPGSRCTAQRQQRVHPRPRPEGLPGGRRPGPHIGGIRDQRRIGEAVQLEHGAEADASIRGHHPDVTAPLPTDSLRPHAVRLDPQRDPHARVMSRGDLRGPGPLFGDVLRGGRQGRRPGDQRRAGGARQPVRHRVEKGPYLPLGVRQRQRVGIRERDGVRVGGHRGGEIAQPPDVRRVERPQPPGVISGGTHPGQQPAASREL